MDGHSRDRSTRRGGERHLWTRGDVSRRENVQHGCVIAVVDDESPHLVALAPELSAEIVGGVLSDREVKSLAIE